MREEGGGSPPPQTTNILGFPVSVLSLEEHARLIAERASAGVGLRVVTLNLEMVVRAARDPAYDALVRRADLLVADGVPLLWLSRWRGAAPVRGRTNGTDLVERLLTAAEGPRVALLGGIDPRRTLERLAVPARRVALVENGIIDPADPAMVDAILGALRRAEAELVLVALGVPKQDQLSAAIRDALPAAVVIAVGGALDLLAGLKRRAPGWMQRNGLEWLHRLVTEPRRLWHRYLVLYPRVLPLIVRWARRAR